jgi:autotransporter adhesin
VNSNASGFASTALGEDANASASYSTAVGEESSATGTSSTAIGQFSTASGTFSTAVGTNSEASGFHSTAVGEGSYASGSSATAVGTHAEASYYNSAAFGSNAVATRDNQQVFGTSDNTYTMSGIASQASRNAQSGKIEFVTSDQDGNLATAGGNFFQHLDDLDGGVAMAMALGSIGYLPEYKQGAVAGWYGNYEGTSALGFAGAFKVTDDFQIEGGLAVSLDGDTQVGGRIGGIWAFGSAPPVYTK